MGAPPMSKFARLKLAVSGGDDGAPDAPAFSPMDKRVARRLVTPRRIAMAAGALALILLMAFGYWRYGLVRSLSVDAERLTVSAVRSGLFQEYIPITGNIAPARTVYLDAVEGGQVTDVLAEEGAVVEAGQPLLELKNTNLQLQVVEAESRLTEQVNNLNVSRLTYEQNQLRHQRDLIDIGERISTLQRDLARNERLLAVDAVAAKTVEDMRAELSYQQRLRDTVTEARRVDQEMQTQQVAQLQAAVDRIGANLEIARENLDNLVMKAPIAGQLTIFEANLGESKAPGERIGQIDDVGAFKVAAYVDEFYLNRIAIGQTATAPIGGRQYALEVAKIYPNVTDRQFQVDLEFTGDAPEGVRRGQTLRMNLEIGAEAETLTVENGPWVDDTGGTWAFVLSPDGGSAHRRHISAGRRNPDTVEIMSGLAEGERVITSGYEQLSDFERIDLRGANRR